jgi:hypothetical protein
MTITLAVCWRRNIRQVGLERLGARLETTSTLVLKVEGPRA